MIYIPNIKIIKPQAGSYLKISVLIIRTPNIPDLVSIPDSRAEAGAGATHAESAEAGLSELRDINDEQS